MRNIIINSNNVTNNNNSKYVYSFPTGTVFFKNSKIALQSLSIYYSNFNISSSVYNNHQFKYKWIDGNEFTVTIPDGFYTIDNLNLYFNSIMVANKHYLMDEIGNMIYYLSIQTNGIYYGIQLNERALPDTLPTGWTKPPGATWTTTNKTPQFIIMNNGFTSVIGFSAGIYPLVIETMDASQISSVTPQVSPVNNVLVQCNLVNNNLAVLNNVIYSYTPYTTFGSIMSFNPPDMLFMDIKDGSYSSVEIAFVDQNFRPIKFQDPSMTMILAVMDDSDFKMKL